MPEGRGVGAALRLEEQLLARIAREGELALHGDLGAGGAARRGRRRSGLGAGDAATL